MSICSYLANLLTEVLPLIDDRARKQVLTMGVQTCKFDYPTIEKLFQRHSFSYNPVLPQQSENTTGFFADGKTRSYIHQRTFFEMLGFSRENIRAIDASSYEGAEIVHDLNQPIPDALVQQFDLILDAGTIEHVFSVKDAIVAMAQMCTVGGIVIHNSPVDCINHGFVNFNWRFFNNFYLANGFEFVMRKYVGIPRAETMASKYYLEFEPDAYTDAPGPYYDTYLFSVFRKVKHVLPAVPQQENFVNAWQSRPKQAHNGSEAWWGMRRGAVALLEKSYLGSSMLHAFRTMKYARKTNLQG